jgi:hypothetical protein
VDWLKSILSPSISFGIPSKDSHLFHIFDVVLCDLILFHKNKAVHDGVKPDILVVAGSIKKLFFGTLHCMELPLLFCDREMVSSYGWVVQN